MTAVDVDALDKLREAATAPISGFVEVMQDREYSTDVLVRHRDGGSSVLAECYGENSAALIVAAVNALPELLAEVRRGRALRAAVEGLVEDLDARWGDGFTDQAATRLRAVVAAVDGGEQ